MWNKNQKRLDTVEIRKRVFYLIRLIDGRCANFQELSLPGAYAHYCALNSLLTDEIVILPKFKSCAVKQMEDAIAWEENQRKYSGFFSRNYSGTADISQYLNHFIIHKIENDLCPKLHVLRWRDEIEGFAKSKDELKIGIFPLSKVGLEKLFHMEEKVVDWEEERGLFSIKNPAAGQEEIIYERCKKALVLCKEQAVDIAVFPEMLFTTDVQERIRIFIKENCNDNKKRFPWFIWLGTAWHNRENTCCVVDCYGELVFQQRKIIPYKYNRRKKGQGGNDIKVTFFEDLSSQSDGKRIINFLDIPGFFRIATAICRDISNEYLLALFKQLYSDMAIIPAFSATNRLTQRHIKSLVEEVVITVVCNACSSQCKENEVAVNVEDRMVGKELPFCYLCLPAKTSQDNMEIFHNVKYKAECQHCEKQCVGHIFSISFSKCVKEDERYSANVTYY